MPTNVTVYTPPAFAHRELAAMRRRLGRLRCRAIAEDTRLRDDALDLGDLSRAAGTTVEYSRWHTERIKVEDFCADAYRGRIAATVEDCWTSINALSAALDRIGQ